MNRIALVVVSTLTLCAGLASASPQIGDTIEAVLAEKGQPVGQMGMGRTVMLTYADEVITLKDGKVTAVRPAEEPSTVPDRKITEAEKRRVAAEEAAAAVRAAADVPTSSAWSTDYDAALSTARSQNRNVFLFFTGSDWCGWCIRLNREILNTSAFSQYAGEKLVLVEIDFPKRKAISEQQRSRNSELARKFGVSGFPSVVILNPQGRVIGKVGYREGGPEPFIAALKRM